MCNSIPKQQNLTQVTQIKYLGIIMNHKFRFNEHNIRSREVKKLIHSLSKMAKVTCGITYKAMATIYKGTTLTLLSYSVQVWIEEMNYENII